MSDQTNKPSQTAQGVIDVETQSKSSESLPVSNIFKGHDPFAEFSPDPSSLGGVNQLLGNKFGRVVERLENLSEEILGVRPSIPSISSMQLPRYSVQTASMSSYLDKDGNVQTEQFASSEVGHRTHGIREAHCAYENTRTGVKKRSLEQHLGQQAIKKVKQRGKSGDDSSNEMFLGMDPTQEAVDAFDKDFAAKAEHLPEHETFAGDFFKDFGGGLRFPPLPGAGRWKQSALEPGSQGGA